MHRARICFASAAVLLASLAGAAPAADRDPMARAVRDAVSLVGAPVAGGAAPSGAPAPIPGAAADATIEAIAPILDGIEAWIAWGSRAGAAMVVHGMAGPETREAVEHATREILSGCAAAMAATDRLVERLDADGAAERAETTQVVVARRVSIPLRAARAALWAATARDAADPGATRILVHAAEIAGAVDATRPGPALERAALLAQIALAAAQPDGAAAALAEADRAMRELGADTPIVTRIELGVVRARLAGLSGNPERAEAVVRGVAAEAPGDGPRDFGLVALLAGVRARIALDTVDDERSSAVRSRAAAAAADAIGAIIDDAATTEPSRGVRRASAHESLRGIGSRMRPGDRWPALVVAATADRALGHPNTDPVSFIAWLDAWLADPSAVQDAHADEVRLHLARFLATTGYPADAARAAALAAGFAERHPKDERAGAMVALACAAGVDATRGQEMDHARLVEILRAADSAGFEVPGRDRWRLVLMRTLGDALVAPDDRALAGLLLAQLEIARRIRSADEAREGAERLASDACWMIRSERLAEDGAGADDPIAVAKAVAAHADAAGAGRAAVLTRAEIAMATGRFEEAEAMARTLDPTLTDDRARDVAVRAMALRGAGAAARAMLASMRDAPGAGVHHTAGWIARAAWAWIGPFADALPDRVPAEARAIAMADALLVAAEFDPMDAETGRRAGIAASLAGMHAETVRVLTPARRADPTDSLVGLALAEAMIGLGDDAGAFAILREIAAAGESDRRYDRAYFRAWARMVQILDRQNADGSRTDAITREVFRIRRAPDLAAHADLRAVFDAMAARYPASAE